VEWQAAQTALGLAPAGHAIDVFFLCLWLAGIILWGSRWRFPLRYSLPRFAGLAIAGFILLVALQVGNNRLFDRHITDAKVVNTHQASTPARGYRSPGKRNADQIGLSRALPGPQRTTRSLPMTPPPGRP
jgi:hypothetical protein